MNRRRDTGQAALELLGLLPLLLVVVLATLQIAVAAVTVRSTTNAARAAARAASDAPVQAQARADAAVHAAVPAWLADDVEYVDARRYPVGDVTVRVRIPAVLPLRLSLLPTVTRRAWFPPEVRR
jgi:hypothetical protein